MGNLTVLDDVLDHAVVDTAVLEVDSADAWQSVVSSCFVPLSCQAFEPRFTGRMEHTALAPGLSVSRVTTSGTSAERTERLARRAPGDDLHLSLQRTSSGVVSSGGRSVSVRPGSVSVYPVDAPYYLDYSPPGQQQLIVQVSRTSLGLPSRMIQAATLRLSVPGGITGPAARALFSYVSGFPTERQAEAGGEDIAVVRDLAAVMIRSSFTRAPVTPATSGGLRHTVQEYLRAHSVERGLTMEEVASRHGVSRSRLYQAFDVAGVSPAAYLRSVRIARAAATLTDPAAPGRSIADVAYGCGFDDPLTFSRAFRRKYGCTPSEYRSAWSPGTPST